MSASGIQILFVESCRVCFLFLPDPLNYWVVTKYIENLFIIQIYRSTKEFMKKYGLRLVAATFLIIDSSQASIEIACEWQTCMGGEVFLKDLDCTLSPPRLKKK